MPQTGLRVVIVGGGIGGLCLAQGLRQAGVDVAVYERDRSGTARLDRYRLHVNPAGSRALHACLPAPAWKEFLARAGRSGGGFGFLDEQLRALVVVEDEIMYPDAGGPQDRPYPVDRATLRRVLLTGLDDVVRFGRTFERYDLEPDGGVTARFEDGSSATGDVLVGADGASSRVRRQRLPQAGRVDAGAFGVGLKLALTQTARAWLPTRLAVGENMVMTAAPFFLFTSVFEPGGPAGPEPGRRDRDDPGDYLLCAFVARRGARTAGMEDLHGAALQQAVGELVAGWHPDLRRLIAECDPASVDLYPFASSAPVEATDSSSVVLLGDAIHSMPPTGGNGANTALRDAQLLARQLTSVANGDQRLGPAIATYEADMRDYGNNAVRAAGLTLRQGLTSNPLAVAGIKAWFRLCDTFPAVRRAGFKDTWAKPASKRSWELGGQ
jgi:2-polyprenyl-6-methoxyphenol hydroxylase-like FAD-dependent oxidoreductase